MLLVVVGCCWLLLVVVVVVDVDVDVVVVVDDDDDDDDVDVDVDVDVSVVRLVKATLEQFEKGAEADVACGTALCDLCEL